MNLLWMDVETTGLSSDKHSIIDICFVETNRKGVEQKRYTSKIKPSADWKKYAESRAMEVNHYTDEEWAEAPEIWTVEEALIKVFGTDADKGELLIPAGWNIPFDLGFIREKFNFWDDKSRKRIKFYHHPLDLMGLGWNYIKDKPRAHLNDLCDRLGAELKDAHTAEGDVNAYIECYKRLLF